jgi:penicillin-binding protein 1A
VTLRDALVFSKNVPTITLGNEVGLDKVAAVARETGITEEMDLTPAMPLGTVAVSPLELVTAYTPFATLGTAVEPRFVLAARTKEDKVIWEAKASPTHKVLDPDIAYLVTDVLQDAMNRGTGAAARAAGFAAPAAGKTGTTSDGNDAWFVGYTPAVVAAVWIGHDDAQSLGANATGGRLAAPVWGRIMARSKVGQGGSWTKPDGIVERWVDADTGSVLRSGCRSSSGSGYREVFLRGRVPAESCPQRGDMYAAHRAATAPPVDDTYVEELPREIAGRSEPAPPPAYEEAERASRLAVEKAREAEEATKKEPEVAPLQPQQLGPESAPVPPKPEPPKLPDATPLEPGKVTPPPRVPRN